MLACLTTSQGHRGRAAYLALCRWVVYGMSITSRKTRNNISRPTHTHTNTLVKAQPMRITSREQLSSFDLFPFFFVLLFRLVVFFLFAHYHCKTLLCALLVTKIAKTIK